MDKAEASGKTVEDALNKALAQLGARREEVEFVVLDEGKRGGLFGRGGKEAVVRVERIAGGVQPPSDRGPIDTRIPRGRGGAGGGRPPLARGGTGDRGGGGGARGDRRGGQRTGFEAPVPRLTAEDFVRGPQAPGPGAVEGAAGVQPRARRGRGEREGGAPPVARERPPRREEPEVEPDINAEEVDFAAHVVDDILQLLDINAELTIREPLTPGDGLGMSRAVIDISGDDLGLLIGRRGDTLASLQYIVNLIVGQRFPGKGGVTIDVEHYRHRREEQVVSLARRMADRVRQTGAPITLEPMSAAERRLVHMALSEDPTLETNSIGEGDNRKVVISARR